MPIQHSPEISSAEERAAFLEACKGDAMLRTEVEALLREHESPQQFFLLVSDAPSLSTTPPLSCPNGSDDDDEMVDLSDTRGQALGQSKEFQTSSLSA